MDLYEIVTRIIDKYSDVGFYRKHSDRLNFYLSNGKLYSQLSNQYDEDYLEVYDLTTGKENVPVILSLVGKIDNKYTAKSHYTPSEYTYYILHGLLSKIVNTGNPDTQITYFNITEPSEVSYDTTEGGLTRAVHVTQTTLTVDLEHTIHGGYSINTVVSIPQQQDINEHICKVSVNISLGDTASSTFTINILTDMLSTEPKMIVHDIIGIDIESVVKFLHSDNTIRVKLHEGGYLSTTHIQYEISNKEYEESLSDPTYLIRLFDSQLITPKLGSGETIHLALQQVDGNFHHTIYSDYYGKTGKHISVTVTPKEMETIITEIGKEVTNYRKQIDKLNTEGPHTGKSTKSARQEDVVEDIPSTE